MIDLKYTTNGFDRRIRLPIDEQSVPEVLEPDSIVFVSEIIQPASLKYLAGTRLNIDELNFLAKRMDSFDKREMAQFNAAVGYREPHTGQELINLTFNLPRYTLISDFSSPTEIGKTHILNRKQVMGLDEIARTDFAKIGRDLIISGTGITTEYGVLFINEDIPEETPYDEKHFPAYDYKASPVCVSISCKGETEYLYMPCSVADINNALAKLPAESWNDCKAEIEWDNLPSKEWSDRCEHILQNEDSYRLNEVCKALKGFAETDYAKLSSISLRKKAEYLELQFLYKRDEAHGLRPLSVLLQGLRGKHLSNLFRNASEAFVQLYSQLQCKWRLQCSCKSDKDGRNCADSYNGSTDENGL